MWFGHVGDTRLDRARAIGKAAASGRAERTAPAPAVSAAWSGIRPRIPGYRREAAARYSFLLAIPA
ncbi:hypothetical protein ACWDAZ_36755, partial [Streptomyces sp. NPDC001215]